MPLGRWFVVLASCGHSPAPAPSQLSPPVAQVPADGPDVHQEDVLAAIQVAMTQLAPASQQCWARAATERFDIEGNIDALITVGDSHAEVEISQSHLPPLLVQ